MGKEVRYTLKRNNPDSAIKYVLEAMQGDPESEAEERLGVELAQASRFIPGERVSDYIERLFALYPTREQQAYLSALDAVARPSAYSTVIFQRLYEGEDLDPRMEEVFPRGLNPQLEGVDWESPSSWMLRMQPDYVNRAIVALNWAAYLIEKFGKDLKSQAISQISNVYLNESTNDVHGKLRDKVKIRLAQAVIKATSALPNKQAMRDVITRSVSEKVTELGLDTFTHKVAQEMRSMAGNMGNPIVAVKFQSDYSSLDGALPDLGMHPAIGSDLKMAYQYEIGFLPRG